MPSPATTEAFLDLVRKAEVVDEQRLNACLQQLDATAPPKSPRELADFLVQAGALTKYQGSLLVKGAWDAFRIGPYRILERLGFGVTSNVYLCKHRATQARVAVKVLTAAQAKDPVALKRFFREAKAGAPLDHPNIVRVRDVDWDDDTNFLVMDFVDGSSVQDIVQQFGPMDAHRAAHYVHQAASGLQHAHEHGLVHRDIKPGNLLVDRKGKMKILDMGLARFAEEEGSMEALTQGEVLGSPEYLAPEQAVDSHNVDIRADIYALGATFYFMLTGKPPYSEEKSAAGKLLSKETRPPTPIRASRPEVSEDLVAIVEQMMARNPGKRFAEPRDVAEALAPWGQGSIAPPPDKEMPQLSRAARADKASVADAAATARLPAADTPMPTDKGDSPAEVSWLVQGIVLAVFGIGTFVIAWLLLRTGK